MRMGMPTRQRNIMRLMKKIEEEGLQADITSNRLEETRNKRHHNAASLVWPMLL